MNELRMTLPQAPEGAWVTVDVVTDTTLAARLRRLGLDVGARIMRLETNVTLAPVRVAGDFGEATLSGNMAAHCVMHLDDGRMLPLVECAPGETGHLEGVSGGEALEAALVTLGVERDKPVRMVRQLPPMEYACLVDGARRARLTESMAAVVMGESQGLARQFLAASSGRDFTVRSLLGEPSVNQVLRSMGIMEGSVLVLEAVEQASTMRLAKDNPVTVTSPEGLRLLLDERHAERILVRCCPT